MTKMGRYSSKRKNMLFEVLRDYDRERNADKRESKEHQVIWETEFNKFLEEINKNPKEAMLRQIYVVYSNPITVDLNFQLELEKLMFQVLTHDWDSKNSVEGHVASAEGFELRINDIEKRLAALEKTTNKTTEEVSQELFELMQEQFIKRNDERRKQ